MDDGLTADEALSLFQSLSPTLQAAFIAVGVALVVMAVVAVVVSIWLSIKYVKYNRHEVSSGKSGGEVARTILDNAGLQNIKVTKSGSFIMGNSYSHFFKKVRLRRLTIDKTSLTSVGMGAEKAALAVLDKQGDKDMKRRIWMTPVIAFGPVMFIPLILIGVIVDLIIFNGNGDATIAACIVAIIIYAFAFVFQLQTLKSERRAQDLACQLVTQQGLATDDEVQMLRKLFHLYNVEYVINMVIALLELVWRVLEIIAKMQLKK